jgi:hypothetical protein
MLTIILMSIGDALVLEPILNKLPEDDTTVLKDNNTNLEQGTRRCYVSLKLR